METFSGQVPVTRWLDLYLLQDYSTAKRRTEAGDGLSPLVFLQIDDFDAVVAESGEE